MFTSEDSVPNTIQYPITRSVATGLTVGLLSLTAACSLAPAESAPVARTTQIPETVPVYTPAPEAVTTPEVITNTAFTYTPDVPVQTPSDQPTSYARPSVPASPTTIPKKGQLDWPSIIQFAPVLPNPKGNQKIDPTGITLHWWSESAGGDIYWLANELRENKSCGDTGCSVQYAVTEDGKIFRMMKSGDQWAYHAGKANATTIGIEIEGAPGDFALAGPKLNQKKLNAVIALTAKLIEDYDIPLTGKIDCNGKFVGIHGHHEYNVCSTAGAKLDPGDAYTQAVINGVRRTTGTR